MLPTTQNIIFFDGYCGLCNGFINFIMKIDKRHVFCFSPLQSEYARQHLPPEWVSDLKTVIVQIGGEQFRKSAAVIAIFDLIGPPWSWLSVAGIMPEGWLNVTYDLVAQNRYQIFGKKDSCRLPTTEEKKRFIM